MILAQPAASARFTTSIPWIGQSSSQMKPGVPSEPITAPGPVCGGQVQPCAMAFGLPGSCSYGASISRRRIGDPGALRRGLPSASALLGGRGRSLWRPRRLIAHSARLSTQPGETMRRQVNATADRKHQHRSTLWKRLLTFCGSLTKPNAAASDLNSTLGRTFAWGSRGCRCGGNRRQRATGACSVLPGKRENASSSGRRNPL